MAAYIGASLSAGLSARKRALWINGLDVSASRTPGGNSYGTDPESISVTEIASGGASALEFTITDPAIEVSVSVGQFVLYWDLVKDLPIFAGYVDTFDFHQLGVGREITVSCIGIEAALDWMYVPGFTIPSGTELHAGFQMIAAAAGGIGVPLNAAFDPVGTVSVVGTPVGIGFGGSSTSAACVIPDGTLRQALETYAAFLLGVELAGFTITVQIVVSVDFFLGLRIYRFEPTNGSGTASDLGLVTLRSDTVGKLPSNHHRSVNGSGILRSVYVSGSGSGTGFVGDGSGIVGPTGAISDANSTSADRRNGIGRAALGKTIAGVSGDVTWEGATLNTLSLQRRAGGYLDLLDPQVDVASLTRYPIESIDKTWAPSGEETWVIHYGGAITSASKPKASHVLKSLTRRTIN